LLITDIKYNHLQLPYEITFSNGNNIKWVYDAEGNKLRKVTKTGATTTTTDYCGGIEYKNNVMNAIYHSEGRLTAGAGIAPFSQPRYEYTLTDHLGNGRVYYTDLNNDGIGTMADLLQDNHYYPFGLNHTDPRRNTGGVGVNLYQYNGKELVEDNGLSWHSYGKRYYDAVIGRFPNVDPLIDTFHFVTGYNYAENEPVANIDLWGLQQADPPYQRTNAEKSYENVKLMARATGEIASNTELGLLGLTVLTLGETAPVTGPLLEGADLVSKGAVVHEVIADFKDGNGIDTETIVHTAIELIEPIGSYTISKYVLKGAEATEGIISTAQKQVMETTQALGQMIKNAYEKATEVLTIPASPQHTP
jgi:RHS repeat-associated protein